MRDCPRLRMGGSPQGTQSMVAALVTTSPAQPSRGGGQPGRGRPRREGHAHCYAFSGRTEAVALDTVIIGIVPVCHRDESVLFDLGSTYSYITSYFASYLDISRDSLDIPTYMSTPVGDSIMVDCVYRSCLVIIRGYETRVDLLLLNMVDFDMILGMDWLSPYHAILDYNAKTITLDMLDLPRLE
ncbi:uncharacterized protein [Nicotiana tomentosiformis]|uniref:uncharacterized protein n=1 Tax=Nicotiana tomentosiformis TaxID=4098 RepID=UPI00388C982B